MCLKPVVGLSSGGLVGRPLRACLFLSQHQASLTTRRMATRSRPASPVASPVDARPSKHVRLSPSLTQTQAEQTAASPSTSPAKMTIERLPEPRLLVQLDAEHPNARAPTRGSALAAGYDLYASESVVIPKLGGRKVVPTGIRLAIPVDCYGRVAPRSGLASKHGIDVGAGVIDADYRGLLGVLLFNLGQEDFQVNVGDRIAQLVLERITTPQVEVVESLEETVRGAGGFGSTGGFGPSAPAKEPSSSS